MPDATTAAKPAVSDHVQIFYPELLARNLEGKRWTSALGFLPRLRTEHTSEKALRMLGDE